MRPGVAENLDDLLAITDVLQVEGLPREVGHAAAVGEDVGEGDRLLAVPRVLGDVLGHPVADVEVAALVEDVRDHRGDRLRRAEDDRQIRSTARCSLPPSNAATSSPIVVIDSRSSGTSIRRNGSGTTGSRGIRGLGSIARNPIAGREGAARAGFAPRPYFSSPSFAASSTAAASGTWVADSRGGRM